MPYTPKSHNEILRDLRAMMIGRTSLNDIQTGSVLNTVLKAFAHEVASIERRIYNVREAFFLNGATGTELDERVAELPTTGLQRIGATNGSASCLKIERGSSVGALTIPAGSTVSTEAGIKYRTVADVIIPDADFDVENVQIVAVSAGAVGNAEIGKINTIVDMPDDVISIENTQPITNGGDQETDGQLKSRAYSYLRSLSRCSRSTLEFLALSFVSSNNDRMQFARIYEDPETPSVSELIVDDGSGLSVNAVSKVGTNTSGTIPTNGYRVLYHEAPATAPITNGQLTIRDGSNNPISLTNDQITSIPERGILYVAEGVLEAGYTWEITKYRVYTGFIAELQKEIEGDVDNPSVLTGFRASGTRCIVKVAQAEFAEFDVYLKVYTDILYDPVENQVRTAIANYVNRLAPSDPLYISSLVKACKDLDGVEDVRFFTRGSNERLENIFPSSPRSAIRVKAGSIVITNASEN